MEPSLSVRIFLELERIMKIVYILKKGFQHYPPCLTQVLYLNDLGADLLIYHGKNSDYIDSLFDSRHIEHYDHCVGTQSLARSAAAVHCV